MVRPVFSATSRTVRALHTSAVRADARQITSDFLSRLQTPNASSSAAKPGSAAHDAARGMLGTVGLRDLSVDDGRKTFRSGDITPPHAYDEANLYPERKPGPKPPLLGPKKAIAKRIDPFYIRKANPLDHAVNPLMSYAFINPMGKIKGRNETGLTWKSQRLVGKMVRRARAMGVIPRWNNRPSEGGLGVSEYAASRR